MPIKLMKLPDLVVAALLLAAQAGCLPMTAPPGTASNAAQLTDSRFITEDGVNLPLRRWLPEHPPRAVIVALHGFNDYSRFFESPGDYFRKQGIACFAYDQRGFGAAPQRGLWAGGETYADDLQVFTRLIKQRYPNLPVYLLGESMGGAVIITAARRNILPEVTGVILAAPALWSRSTMSWYETGALWTLAHSLPWLTLTGRGLKVIASDNTALLQAMSRDPLVIKNTRVDSLHGLVDLMDAAYASADALRGNVLLLYGKKDQIVPQAPTYQFLQQLFAAEPTAKTVVIYPKGYHLLLHDLQALTPWQDITAWINANPSKQPAAASLNDDNRLSSR